MSLVIGKVPLIEIGKTQQHKRFCHPIVLIIDETDRHLFDYRRCLEDTSFSDYDVHFCQSAKDALQLCLTHVPVLILLNYQLPDINGLQLIPKLLDQISALPLVILLLDQFSNDYAQEAFSLGIMDCEVKDKLSAMVINKAVYRFELLHKLDAQHQIQLQQRELLTQISIQVSRSIDVSRILSGVVEGMRKLFNCDRTLVYQFAPDMTGTVVAESVDSNWTSALSHSFEDNCFQSTQDHDLANKYLLGCKMVASDIEQAGLSQCHIEMLKQYEVRSNLVVPIIFQGSNFSGEKRLWGLLIAHHCESVHQWQLEELHLIDSLSLQVAIAIQHLELVESLQTSLEKQLEIEKQLRQQNQQLDEFAHVVSHDLKAPLRGISNLATWLAEDLECQLSEDSQTYLQQIQTQVLQLNTMIEGLLEYAKIGRINVKTSTVDLNKLIDETITLLQPPSTFQIKVSQSLPTICTQVLLLKQVFLNLIGNAIKYNDKSVGKLDINIQDHPHQWEFSLTDNGPGIPSQYQSTIFNLFQTLSERNGTQGTGIGLAIVKKIIEDRGGSVWVESYAGNGSTFGFTWPK